MNNPHEQLSDAAKPYLTPTGSLIIPHNTEAKYRYWQGGQTVLATLRDEASHDQLTEAERSCWN